MTKRDFLRNMAVAAFSMGLGQQLWPEDDFQQRTHTYKEAGNCEIKLDAFGSPKQRRNPALVWIHGGALITGTRSSPPQWLNRDGKYTVISIDYRLAPETKLPGIIEDLTDAYRWIIEHESTLGIDRNHIAVAGQSAGGYLALMAGVAPIRPKPKALLALSGYGNLIGDWYTHPSQVYLNQPAVSRSEAYASVTTHCYSGPSTEVERKSASSRNNFYLYCRQQGRWPLEVSGHDPLAEPKWFDRYCPVRNISHGFPPTILIHGTNDTDVPYEESVKLDEQLTKFAVAHRFISVPGGSHCLADDPPELKSSVMREAMAFVDAHAT